MTPLTVWDITEVRKWSKAAKRNQLKIREELYGNREYDLFESTDYEKSLLRKKISYLMFGPPKCEDSSTKTTKNEEEGKEKKLTNIFNLVCKKNEGQTCFRISILSIECLTREGNFYSPVIRLHLTDDATKVTKSVFIDNVPRSYEGFNDYLQNNRLPKCLMCYPACGSYYLREDDIGDIDVRKSSACDAINAVLKGTDITSTVVGLGAIGMYAACVLSPPLAIPALTIGTLVSGSGVATYRAARGVAGLHNRNVHGQTLGLCSPEARDCWFAIGGAAVAGIGVGVAVGVGQAARMGVEVAEAVARTPVFISVSVSGLGVINNVANIFQKLLNGGQLDIMDGVYLAASIFLFSNIMVSACQMNAIITDMKLNGENPGNFFKDFTSFIRENSEFEYVGKTNAVLNFTTFGILFNHLSYEDTLSNCFQSLCRHIVDTTIKFVEKHLTAAGFAESISKALEEFCFQFAHEMEDVAQWYCKMRGHKTMGGVFGQITQPESLEVAKTLYTMGSWLVNHVSEKALVQSEVKSIRVHKELTNVITLHEEIGTIRPEDGAKQWANEFEAACTLVKLEFNRQTASHEQNYNRIKEFLPELTINEFNEREKVTGSLDEHLWKKALAQVKKDFGGKDNLLSLAEGLLSVNPGFSGLEDPVSGTRVHLFTGVQPAESDHQLSRDQYRSVAREAVGSALALDRAVLEVDVNTRTGMFLDVPANDEGVSYVVVKCMPERGFVAGIVTVVKL